jgi:hypothetical protein
MLATIESLPDTARIWIFPADRKLSAKESEALLDAIDAYLVGWKAHGAPVQAARDLRYGQFLIIAADPEVTAPSGCSIDDLTRTIKSLSSQFAVDFFNPMRVFYHNRERIEVTDRPAFRSLANAGEVNSETTVFDNSVTTLAALRSGKWEVSAGESWHQTLMNA